MSDKPKQERLHDHDDPRTGGFGGTVFATLFAAYRPFLGRIGFAALIGIIGRGLLLANANLIGLWVDSLCTVNCRPQPAFLAGWTHTDYLHTLLMMAIAGFFFTLLFRVVFSRLSAQSVSRIYDEVTLRVSRAPMSFFDANPAGRIITRFSSDYGNVFRLFGGPLAEFLSIIFDLTMMVILIGVASPWYLLFIGGVGFLNYIVYRFHRARLRELRRALSASRSPSIAHFAETTQGSSTIRSFQREDSFKQRFDRLDTLYLDRKLVTSRGLIGYSFQMNALSALLLLVTGVCASALVQKGVLTVGSVGVAFTFIAMSGNTLQMFFDWLSQLEEAMIGVERLDRYLRKPIENGSRLPAQARFPTEHAQFSFDEETRLSTARLTTAKAASVDVKDLWFRYNDHQPWVLKGVGFSLRPGERLGIVGRTGSGKSSLIQTLFHLYPIQKGEIAIDGVKARVETVDGLDLQVYRRAVAFIAQDPVLFQGSLRDNLDVEGYHTDVELLEVLDQVGLGDWARTNPLGLQARIEERGKNLSLGERQLLCMARCLLQDAPVVIMDEATSSVDPQSEEILVRATEEFFEGRTQIVIAHRLSTLQKCDRILWLHDGEVKRLGPTAEVLADFERIPEISS